MKKIYLILYIFLCCGLTNYAQISYTGNSLLVGDVPYAMEKSLTISGFDGLKWQNSVGNFLMIDLRDETHISGTGDCVKFYDYDTDRYTTILANEVHQLSDMRAKSDIVKLDNSKIMKLTPVSYKCKDCYASKSADESKTSVGLIAEELQEVYPEVISEDDMGNLMINYQALIPILIKSLQELDQQVTRQTQEINELLNQLKL